MTRAEQPAIMYQLEGVLEITYDSPSYDRNLGRHEVEIAFVVEEKQRLYYVRAA